jgi:hypothetical protein
VPPRHHLREGGDGRRRPYHQGMLRISGTAVCRVAAAFSLAAVVAAMAACGGEPAEGGGEDTSSGSPSASETTEPSASSGSHEPGSSADGECGGGGVDVQEVEAARGVRLTVPAGWTVETSPAGRDTRLHGPDRDAVEGQVVVQDKYRTLDDAMRDLERLTSATTSTSRQELSLDGFDAARMHTYTGDDGVLWVAVAAVDEGELGVIAYVILEDAPGEAGTVESCLSTLRRRR